MNAAPASLVFNYRKIGRYGLNAICGAVEACADLDDMPVVFARDGDGLEDAARRAAAAGTAVVAWSFYSPGFAESAAELDAFRERFDDPRVLHIAGGPHASAEPEMTLRAGFDAVAIGEGERTIVDFLRALRAGSDWREVRGIACIDDGKLRRNAAGELVDLDDCPPFPTRAPYSGPIEITRGCVFACSFCQTPFVSKARFRHRSVENVCHWIRFQRAKNLRDIRFVTPTAMSYGSHDEGANFAAVEELLVRAREAAGPQGRLFYGTFPSEIRPEHVTHEALRLIERTCDNRNIIVGGQSGSDATLARIHRGHDVEAVRRAVAVAVECGFVPNVDFLFGLPGETADDAEATRILTEELAARGARIHTHTFMPLPGTPLRHAEAGTVDANTQRTLGRLGREGLAYGQWQRQAQVAAEIAARRRSSPA